MHRQPSCNTQWPFFFFFYRRRLFLLVLLSQLMCNDDYIRLKFHIRNQCSLKERCQYVKVGSLLTCEKHMHDHILSPWGAAWAHKTRLTPPLFNTCIYTGRSRICVLVVSILPFLYQILELFRRCVIFCCSCFNSVVIEHIFVVPINDPLTIMNIIALITSITWIIYLPIILLYLYFLIY